jgi:hypothetical protein
MLGFPRAEVSRSWFESLTRIAVLFFEVYYGEYAVALPHDKIGAIRFNI